MSAEMHITRYGQSGRIKRVEFVDGDQLVEVPIKSILRQDDFGHEQKHQVIVTLHNTHVRENEEE